MSSVFLGTLLSLSVRLLQTTCASQHRFRRILRSGHKAAFLTRALLFPLPTVVDYRLYWNMSEKRSETRVKVLELKLGSFPFSSGKLFVLNKKWSKINHHIHDTSVLPAVSCLPVRRGFISLASDDEWTFSWGIFSVTLNSSSGQTQLIFVILGLHMIAWPGVTAFLFPKLKMFTCGVNVSRIRGMLWNVVC